MMLRALIVADDLSGAADCGAAFAAAGMSTVVSLDDDINGTSALVGAEVMAVDADTRHLPAGAAADVVRRLVLLLAAGPDLLFLKKIDSTLRGHVGAELRAALDAYRGLHPDAARPVAVFAPAFPSIGRITVNGTQWMHGSPLHESEMWRLHAMTHSAFIPDMLRTAGLQVATVPLSTIRCTNGRSAQAMRLAAGAADVLVCDAESDGDLNRIAQASLDLGRKVMFVGSAGLAHHLPLAVGLGRAQSAKPNLPPVSGPLLFVIGSLSRRSIEQTQVLTASAALHLCVPPDILLSGADAQPWRAYERQLQQAIARQEDVVLRPGTEIEIDRSDRPLLSASLARMTAGVSHQVGALIAAGGETARCVLQCWGVRGLRLLGEVEKGVPVSVTEGWSRRLPVITKAGDFGGPETLLRCGRFLRATKGGLQ